jgi:hypothetical protein
MKRFDVLENSDGFSTVYDVFTGKAAGVNDIVLDKVAAAQAGQWVT